LIEIVIQHYPGDLKKAMGDYEEFISNMEYQRRLIESQDVKSSVFKPFNELVQDFRSALSRTINELQIFVLTPKVN
ncbi:MAG: hypothetical protein MHPSP_001699, partial [Paramarteilia canceri]